MTKPGQFSTRVEEFSETQKGQDIQHRSRSHQQFFPAGVKRIHIDGDEVPTGILLLIKGLKSKMFNFIVDTLMGKSLSPKTKFPISKVHFQ